MKLYPYQEKIINEYAGKSCAIYFDMGLGKTYIGSELSIQSLPVLVVCQASKVDDWIEHYEQNYPYKTVCNLRNGIKDKSDIYIINYDLVHRRKLPKCKTLMLDESQNIKNFKAKRTKTIMKYNAERVILLSGTPCGGKYEELYTQLKLLGLTMTKREFINSFCLYHTANFGTGFDVMVIDGYVNVDELKKIMHNLNCSFMTTEDAQIDLPDQIFIEKDFKITSEIKKLKKDGIVKRKDDTEWISDSTMAEMIAMRNLCSTSNERIKYFADTIESTNKQMVVFYNFNYELGKIIDVAEKQKKTYCIINGENHTLNRDSDLTIVQYQAGASGLNLQYADTIYYFSLPLSSIDFEQSKKRIHRIGQTRTCVYFVPFTKSAIDDKIYRRLKEREDYTEELYKNGS